MIGIIAVLIGMLLPAMASARFESRTVQCQSNVRQIALALIGYASEYKGKFPPNFLAPAPGQFWFDDGRIGSYLPLPPPGRVPDVSVYVCPEDEGARRSYAMNLWASCKVDAIYLAPPKQGELWAANVKHASKLLLVTEAWSYQGSAAAGYACPPTVGSRGDPGKRFGGGGGLPNFSAGRWGIVNCELAYARHRRRVGPGTKTQPLGRIAVAFADGHVDLLTNDSLVDFNTGDLTGLCFWSPLDFQ